MSYANGRLQCDMTTDCANPVTHVDEKGFIYCCDHGVTRKNYCRCRKLLSNELRTLRNGKPIHYDPRLNRKYAEHDQRAEDESNYNRMIGESLKR
jgi:hypothetical protein